MDIEDEIEVLSGSSLAHTAIMTAVLSALQKKGLLNQAEINDIIDIALVGAETAVGVNPRVIDHTRRMLEQTSQNMGGRLGRRRLWP